MSLIETDDKKLLKKAAVRALRRRLSLEHAIADIVGVSALWEVKAAKRTMHKFILKLRRQNTLAALRASEARLKKALASWSLRPGLSQGPALNRLSA